MSGATMMQPAQWRVTVVTHASLDGYAASLQRTLNDFGADGYALYRMEPMRVEVTYKRLHADADQRIEEYSTVVVGVRGYAQIIGDGR